MTAFPFTRQALRFFGQALRMCLVYVLLRLLRGVLPDDEERLNPAYNRLVDAAADYSSERAAAVRKWQREVESA